MKIYNFYEREYRTDEYFTNIENISSISSKITWKSWIWINNLGWKKLAESLYTLMRAQLILIFVEFCHETWFLDLPRAFINLRISIIFSDLSKILINNWFYCPNTFYLSKWFPRYPIHTSSIISAFHLFRAIL